MDPKAKTALAVIAGIVIGVVLVGVAVAVPMAFSAHARMFAADDDRGWSFDDGDDEYRQGPGMMGGGMMGGRGGAPAQGGCGMRGGQGGCAGGDCPQAAPVQPPCGTPGDCPDLTTPGTGI